MSVKELKSIELSSYTIMTTAIAVLFSIISSVVVVVAFGIISPSALGASIYLVPTIIVGTLMYTTYNAFCQGYLYNLLAKRMNTIKFAFKNENEIVKVSTTETAIIISMIITIQAILLYLVSVFIVPLLISSIMQTLMYSGQTELAYGLYQFLMLLSQPITIAMFIFGTFIISFIFILLGCYIYNILGNAGRGAVVNLTKEDNYTAVESIDVLKFAVVVAVVGGILNLLLSIITLTSGDIASAIGSIIGGFIGAFIEGALLAVFYNFLAPKLGKIKLELIDH